MKVRSLKVSKQIVIRNRNRNSSSMLIDMVTAAINVNVRLEVYLNRPESKNFKANRGKTMVPG